MKTFKRIDLLLQILLIGGSLVYIGFAKKLFFLDIYFIVGGWQLFSCFIHAVFESNFIEGAGRTSYLQTLLGVLIFSIVAFIIPLWIFFGFVLLIVSPFLAAWYLTICVVEYRLLKARALIHLK